MRIRQPEMAMAAVKRMARLGAGLLVAVFVFSAVPAVQGNAAPAASVSGLRVQDRSHDNDNPDNQLYAHYQIINSGTSAVPLSSLTMRYWFTNEAPADPLVFACDYALVNCSNVSARFVVLSPTRSMANTYVEI